MGHGRTDGRTDTPTVRYRMNTRYTTHHVLTRAEMHTTSCGSDPDTLQIQPIDSWLLSGASYGAWTDGQTHPLYGTA